MEVNFERKTFQRKIFAIKQVINECPVFDIAYMKGNIYVLQPKVTHEKDGKILGIRKGVLKNQRKSMKIVLFRSVIDEVSNNTCHDFKKIRIQEFMDVFVFQRSQKCISKCQDICKWCKLSTFAYGKKLKSKAIPIDLKKLVQTYLQSVFKSPVNIDNVLA